VYDMYPWHSVSPGGRPPQTPPAWGAATSPHTPPAPPGGDAINAVQVALDRRDNGGDAAAASGTPTVGPTRQ
jgi:hypothetical protein